QELPRLGVRERIADGGDQRPDVLLLVVNRHDDGQRGPRTRVALGSRRRRRMEPWVPILARHGCEHRKRSTRACLSGSLSSEPVGHVTSSRARSSAPVKRMALPASRARTGSSSESGRGYPPSTPKRRTVADGPSAAAPPRTSTGKRR